jgi:hypothetical protein
MKTRPSSVQMHKQTTAVNPTGVNKIPPNFDTPPAATSVAIRLFKELSMQPLQWPFGVKWLNALHWFGHVQRMEENNSPKSIIYEFGNRRRGRPRNRWQDEVREDGRLIGGKGWKERVYNREEWKKRLRTARNRHILHMPME